MVPRPKSSVAVLSLVPPAAVEFRRGAPLRCCSGTVVLASVLALIAGTCDRSSLVMLLPWRSCRPPVTGMSLSKPWWRAARPLQGGRTTMQAGGDDGRSFRAGPVGLDEETVKLHQAYHDRTIDFTMQNYEWVNSKAYATDAALSKEEEQLAVWRAAQARNRRWPRLQERDINDAPLGPESQRFCTAPDNVALGDPLENVFVINLMRRPTKLRRVLSQLHNFGISAKIVDAIDGDAFTSQEEVRNLGAQTLPGYVGHKNTLPYLTTGQLGCFMSHYTIWDYMVEKNIQSALILEDDFDLQEDFVRRLGEMLEAARGEDWNLMYVGRSPTEGDIRQVAPNLTQPGYTLWTVGYIFRLDAAKALVEQQVQRRLAPLDHYFSVAMSQGLDGHWNENALAWSRHIPQVLKGLAITPPLVMPYAGSMFLSDTAMFRKGTKFLDDLPETGESDVPLPGGGAFEARWRENKGIPE